MDYEKEILDFLEKEFREDWMDDTDWDEFLNAIWHETGVTIGQLCNELEVGIKNGYSMKVQFKIISEALNKTR